MSLIAGIPETARFSTDSFQDETIRERVTPTTVKAVVRVLDEWRVTGAQAAALMGMPSRTWYRLKSGERTVSLSQDELTRASYLIGIYKGLNLLFSAPLCNEWPTLPNAGESFGGRSPADYMVEQGIPAMMQVRRHVDALRGGL